MVINNGSGSGRSPQQPYASVLTMSTNLSPSVSQPAAAAASFIADKLYCTIDTFIVEEENKSKAQLAASRKAIKKEIRAIEGRSKGCVAVVKDAMNHDRIKVTCKDETELQRVKKAIKKTAVLGARVLRDQLYPVKVDNANQIAILDQERNAPLRATKALGKRMTFVLPRWHSLAAKT